MADLREAVAKAIDPLAWLEYGDRSHRKLTLRQADAALDALHDRLLPEIPDYIKRLTITTARWDIDFYTHAFPNDNGQIWQDANGDDQAVAFGVAASVCEIPGADEWSEWDCYPESDGWVVFADNDGETGHPQGDGPTIPAAIRNALEADRG